MITRAPVLALPNTNELAEVGAVTEVGSQEYGKRVSLRLPE